MDIISSLLDPVRRHKYLVTFAVFIVIIGFLDDNSILYRLQLSREESALRSEIEKYQAQYDESTRQLDELNADSTSIERIARERYLMKRPDEDIFVFEGDIKN